CLLLRDLQPFTPPYPFHAFMIYMPTGVVQQSGDHPIAISPVGASERDDVFRQPFFVRGAARNLALRRAVLPEDAAGAALGYAEGLPHLVIALATARRA